ncbi:MAG: hypothetical protein KAI44_02795, partial [Methylococcales bacterium]|nr:hypothetical protein [Methylococcales bacterium]
MTTTPFLFLVFFYIIIDFLIMMTALVSFIKSHKKLSLFVCASLLFSTELLAKPYAYITNQLDNTVSVIDTDTYE